MHNIWQIRMLAVPIPMQDNKITGPRVYFVPWDVASLFNVFC